MEYTLTPNQKNETYLQRQRQLQSEAGVISCVTNWPFSLILLICNSKC